MSDEYVADPIFRFPVLEGPGALDLEVLAMVIPAIGNKAQSILITHSGIEITVEETSESVIARWFEASGMES
jgi:hypothetical protein